MHETIQAILDRAKPCPFCGGHDLDAEVDALDNYGQGNVGYVQCTDCDIRGPMSEYKYDDPMEAIGDAIERWNRRAP
jgi:Lar family restriction alleviation protein